MVIKFKQYAGLSERFSSDAFDSMIGNSFVAKVKDKNVGMGKLLSANVVEKGRAVELEIEWPDDSPLKAFLNNEAFSFITSNEEHL